MDILSVAPPAGEAFAPGRRFVPVCVDNPFHVDSIALAEVRRLPVAGLLDVGCADGRFARAVEQADFRVGLELDHELARRAGAVCDRVIVGDVQDPGVVAAAAEHGPYDVVLALDVIEHLARPEATLSALTPLLSARGRVVVGVPNLLYYRERLRLLAGRFETSAVGGLYDRTHLRFFSRRELALVLERAGLVVERLVGAGNVRPGRRIGALGRPARAVHALASGLAHGAAQARPQLMARSFVAVGRPARPSLPEEASGLPGARQRPRRRRGGST